MTSIVEKVVDRFYVKIVKGIQRAFVIESEKKDANGNKLVYFL